MTTTLCILLRPKMAIKIQHKIVTKINLRFMAKGYAHFQKNSEHFMENRCQVLNKI